MKLTKYLLVACSALFLASCSDDENLNTDGNVTVQFASATTKAKENADLFYVPLEVTGKTNGPIRVTVDVTETSASPAIADDHYIVTSKTVVIPNDSTQVNIEIAAINDMEINDDRQFTITITNVEGAKVGQISSTVVTITDDDSLFYEAIQGQWTFTDINFFDDVEESFKMNFVGVDDSQEDYEKILYLSGFSGRSNLVAEVQYSYDDPSQTIYLEFELGQVLGQLNFTGLGVCDVCLFGVSGNYLVDEGVITAIANTDMHTITFDPMDVFYLGVVSNGEYMGGFDGFTTMSMSR